MYMNKIVKCSMNCKVINFTLETKFNNHKLFLRDMTTSGNIYKKFYSTIGFLKLDNI